MRCVKNKKTQCPISFMKSMNERNKAVWIRQKNLIYTKVNNLLFRCWHKEKWKNFTLFVLFMRTYLPSFQCILFNLHNVLWIDERQIFWSTNGNYLFWWHKAIRILTFTNIELTMVKIHPKNKKVHLTLFFKLGKNIFKFTLAPLSVSIQIKSIKLK